jgi:septal ring factor EnvC (AmiA/AmiB activator)
MAEPAQAVPRETAERTFTEGEAYALVADNVQRETASLTASVDQLTSEKAALETEKATLQNQLDVAVAAREKAEQDLADFKESVENEKAVAARTDQRVAKVREVAKHLKDEFYTPERAQRWAAMDDDAFDAYVKELAELSAGVTTTTSGEPPRETAMAGSRVTSPTKGGLAAFWNLPKGGN